jgi:hypothetical protein
MIASVALRHVVIGLCHVSVVSSPCHLSAGGVAGEAPAEGGAAYDDNHSRGGGRRPPEHN